MTKGTPKVSRSLIGLGMETRSLLFRPSGHRRDASLSMSYWKPMEFYRPLRQSFKGQQGRTLVCMQISLLGRFNVEDENWKAGAIDRRNLENGNDRVTI